MVIGFLGGGRTEANHPSRTDQKIGEYCQGADVAECRAMFGIGLARICATCPN